MMLGVLVLVGARQEGPCCDVMFSGFCGLVPVGVFGFLLFWVLRGFSHFFLFLVLVSFCILPVCLEMPLRFLYNFSAYLYKKKIATCNRCILWH